MWMKWWSLQVLAYILPQNAMRGLTVMKVSILNEFKCQYFIILTDYMCVNKIPRKAIKSTYFANLLHNVWVIGFRIFTPLWIAEVELSSQTTVKMKDPLPVWGELCGLRWNRVGFSDKTPQTFQTLGATRGDHVTREERSLNRKHYTFAVDV